MKSIKIYQACKKHYQPDTLACRRYMLGATHQWLRSLLDYACAGKLIKRQRLPRLPQPGIL